MMLEERRGGEGSGREVGGQGAHLPTIMRVCVHHHKWEADCAPVCTCARQKKKKKTLNAKSVRQSESDSVSFCLVMCVRQCCC